MIKKNITSGQYEGGGPGVALFPSAKFQFGISRCTCAADPLIQLFMEFPPAFFQNECPAVVSQDKFVGRIVVISYKVFLVSVRKVAVRHVACFPCVEAESVVVENVGDVILFIMADKDDADAAKEAFLALKK